MNFFSHRYFQIHLCRFVIKTEMYSSMIRCGADCYAMSVYGLIKEPTDASMELGYHLLEVGTMLQGRKKSLRLELATPDLPSSLSPKFISGSTPFRVTLVDLLPVPHFDRVGY